MLTVDVTLYAKERGGRQYPIAELGYGCFCKINPQDERGFACRVNFYCKYPIIPGETRRADIFLITGEDAEPLLRRSSKFFLFENQIIGEARLCLGKPAVIVAAPLSQARSIRSARWSDTSGSFTTSKRRTSTSGLTSI